jgi:DNA relaxase NicK
MNTKSKATWTIAEIQFLKNNHKLLSADEMVKKLKRTVGSVITKIQKLGLGDRLKTVSFLQKEDSCFKVWQLTEKLPEYIIAENSLKAIAKFLRIKKIDSGIQYCEQNEADICCQGNDNRRTKKYYKFI